MTKQTPEIANPPLDPDGVPRGEWAHAETADALSGNGRFILPLQAFLDLEPEVRGRRKERIGVLLQPGDQLEKSQACSTSCRLWRWLPGVQ